MKVVINRCFGGFGLSLAGYKMLLSLKNLPCYFYKQTKYEWQDGRNEYKKVDETEKDQLFVFPTTTDYGDATPGFPDVWDRHGIDRADPDLVKTVEVLGKIANGPCSDLKVVDVPDDVEYEIEEYDGLERIAEKHRTWYE